MVDRSSMSLVLKSVMWPPAQGTSTNLEVSAPPFPVTQSPPRPMLNTSAPDVPVQTSPLLSEVKVWPPADGAPEPPDEDDPSLDDPPPGGSTRWPFCQARLDGLTPSRVVTSQFPDTPARPSRSTHTWVPPWPSDTSATRPSAIGLAPE